MTVKQDPFYRAAAFKRVWQGVGKQFLRSCPSEHDRELKVISATQRQSIRRLENCL